MVWTHITLEAVVPTAPMNVRSAIERSRILAGVFCISLNVYNSASSISMRKNE